MFSRIRAVSKGENMNKDMHKIVFDSRTEIIEVVNALEILLIYVKKYGDNETLKKLRDLLDALYMS